MSAIEYEAWSVAVYNDDYTPMHFVIIVLMNVFNKSLAEATDMMMFIHENDCLHIGSFAKDVASTKANKIIEMADANRHPLYAEIIKASKLPLS